MAVTSYLSCGTCVDDISVGTIVWSIDDSESALVGNEVSSDNGTYAGIKPISLGVSHYLKCTNFGFTSSDVPSGSAINGFEIEVRQFRSGVPTITSTLVKFVKGGTISGNNIGTASDWDTSETAVVYGNSTELGGVSWTQSDVVASNFGCAISITLSSIRVAPVSRTDFIDQVRIRVYYTVAEITGVTSMTGVTSLTM